VTERRPEESFRHRYRERLAATERKGVMGPGRLARTVVLAVMALSAVMFYAVREMGVEITQLREYALVSLLFVGAVIVIGALFGVLLALLRGRR
jgi:hypothetical protein